MAIGIPIGMPVGLAIGNIALGPVIGILIGTVLGFVLRISDDSESLISGINSGKNKTQIYLLIIGLVVFLTLLIWMYSNGTAVTM